MLVIPTMRGRKQTGTVSKPNRPPANPPFKKYPGHGEYPGHSKRYSPRHSPLALNASTDANKDAKAECFEVGDAYAYVMQGRIEAEKVRGVSVLTRLYSTYPLRLIRQQPWLNHASVVALGFGGGLVHGDRVDLQLRLKAGALVW
jgi:hypothetical protein